METKSCTKILNLSTRLSCEYLAVEGFVTVFMGKNLDGEMFGLGMVSTHLSMRGRYNMLEMSTYFFLRCG